MDTEELVEDKPEFEVDAKSEWCVWSHGRVRRWIELVEEWVEQFAVLILGELAVVEEQFKVFFAVVIVL